MKRVALFVDWDNLYKGTCKLYNLHEVRIDVESFVGNIVKEIEGGMLFRTYIYTAEFPADDSRHASQQRFLYALRRIGLIQIRLGSIVRRELPGIARLKKELEEKNIQINFKFQPLEIQKGVDVRIAVDMLQLAWSNAYDVAALISGDGDLAEAAQRVRELGKWLFVFHHDDSVSPRLLECCDRAIKLTVNHIPLLSTTKQGQLADESA